MRKIRSQIKELQKQIKIPWRILYVNRIILPDEYEVKTIYVHIWI